LNGRVEPGFHFSLLALDNRSTFGSWRFLVHRENRSFKCAGLSFAVAGFDFYLRILFCLVVQVKIFNCYVKLRQVEPTGVSSVDFNRRLSAVTRAADNSRGRYAVDRGVKIEVNYSVKTVEA
jgi:hypothetical protein